MCSYPPSTSSIARVSEVNHFLLCVMCERMDLPTCFCTNDPKFMWIYICVLMEPEQNKQEKKELQALKTGWPRWHHSTPAAYYIMLGSRSSCNIDTFQISKLNLQTNNYLSQWEQLIVRGLRGPNLHIGWAHYHSAERWRSHCRSRMLLAPL